MDIKVVFVVSLISSVAAQVVIPATGQNQPSNVFLQLISEDSFVISWTPPLGEFDYYMLDYYPKGGQTPLVRVAVNETERFHVEVNKDINKNKIGVNFYSVLGEKASKTANVVVLQEHDQRLPPKIVSATKQWISQTAVELQWSLPKQSLGVYNELHLLYAPNDKPQDDRAESIKLAANATSYRINNLIRSKQYMIHLYTVNNGLHSDPADLQILPDAPHGCSGNPCKRGGTCVENPKDPHVFTCTCKAGFDGLRCENNINDCNPNPCKNKGLCIDGVDSHTCVCDLGFFGDLCQALSGGVGLRATMTLSLSIYALCKIFL